MTYRQWLIGKALSGIISGYTARPLDEPIPSVKILAQHAIEAADAVILELDKEAK